MEFKKNIPIYLQIMDKLKQDISLKVLKPGDKLMSTRELASELKVNPNTIARVYKELEMENIVFTKRGMGTFIVEEEKIVEDLNRKMVDGIIKKFLEEMKKFSISKEAAIKLLEEREGK